MRMRPRTLSWSDVASGWPHDREAHFEPVQISLGLTLSAPMDQDNRNTAQEPRSLSEDAEAAIWSPTLTPTHWTTRHDVYMYV